MQLDVCCVFQKHVVLFWISFGPLCKCIVLKVNFLIRILNTILYFYYFRLLCGWRLLGIMVYSSTARVGNSRKNSVSIRSFSHCKYIYLVLMIDKVSFAPHMNIWIILCSDFFFLSLFLYLKCPKVGVEGNFFDLFCLWIFRST